LPQGSSPARGADRPTGPVLPGELIAQGVPSGELIAPGVPSRELIAPGVHSYQGS